MLQITFEISHNQLDDAEALLSELGALSVTFQDAKSTPILEPGPGEMPLWPSIRVRGLYPPDTNAVRLQRALRRHFDTAGAADIETLPDKDWSRAWIHDFQPARFGSNLWICPSWCQPPKADAINILLDPGLAFGTGTHPTTALCLEWLDRHPPHALTVVDYGCGSGILGIAAARLGATHVVAVDNEPQALTATQSNAANNGLGAGHLTTQQPADPLPGADLVIANILSQPLIAMADHLTRPLGTGGRIVLSGILAGQAERVRSAYSEYCGLQPPVEKGGWVLLEGRIR